MLKYSREAQFGRAFLLRSKNEFDLFIEDETGKQLFDRYFSRLLQGRYSIANVYPLNGRDFVIAKANQTKCDAQRCEVYIIDGDLNLLDGETDEYQSNNLIRLNCYCIENLVACEKGLQEAGSDFGLSKELEPYTLITQLKNELRELYSSYYANHKLNCGVKTASTSILKYYKQHETIENCKQSIINDAEAIANALLSKAYADTIEHLRDSARRQFDSSTNWVRFLSGKTAIMPIFRLLLSNASQYRSDDDSLKRMLARYCILNDELKERIISCIEMQTAMNAT